MKRRLFHLSSFLILLFGIFGFAGFAFAAALNIPATDLSIGYLTSLFGPIAGAPGVIVPTTGTIGTATSLFGIIFRDLNYGILTIATLILSYTTVRVIVDTARDGEPMGKKISHWIVARTAIGIGLLVPKATGYTMLQSATLWMVVQGVGLANVIWQDVLDYVNKGGTVYKTAVLGSGEEITSARKELQISGDLATGGSSSSGVLSNDPSTNIYAGAISILRAHICMQTLQDTMRKDAEFLGSWAKTITGRQVFTSSINLDVGINQAEKTISFPGMPSNLPKSLMGVCGKFRVAWDENLGYPESGSTGNDTEYINTKLMALQNMVSSLAGITQGLYQNPPPSPDQFEAVKSQNQSIANSLISAANTYQNSIARIRELKAAKYKSISEQDAEFKELFEDASKKGWATAGQHYYSLAKRTQTQPVDNIFYRIWTDNNSVTTKAGILRLNPAPSAGSSAATNLYDTYKKAASVGGDFSEYFLHPVFTSMRLKVGLFKDLYPDLPGPQMLQDQLNPYLTWLDYINDQELQPYIVSLNDALMQIGAGLGAGQRDPKVLALINQIRQTSSSGLVKPPIIEMQRISSLIDNLVYVNLSILGIGSVYAFVIPFYAIFKSLMWQGIENALQKPTNVVRGPLRVCVTKVIKSWINLLMESSAVAPIQKLHTFGSVIIDNVSQCWHQIMTNLVNAYIGVITANAISSNVLAVWNGIVNIASGAVIWIPWVGYALSQLIKATSDWIQQLVMMVVNIMWKTVSFNMLAPLPMALGITAILFSMGITLFFYVPLIPYLLFTFGIISWLIFVIEAVTASAIVALGLMDPRAAGDEIWGRAEPAQMLWLAVFLRPSTMLIGLLAGSVLLYVAMSIVNFTFLGFLASLNITPDVLSLKYLGIMVAYVLIMVSIVSKCYECIYSIPDQIMQWVGAHTRPSSDVQMVHELKQGLSQVAGETAGVAKAVTEKAAAGVEAGYHPGR